MRTPGEEPFLRASFSLRRRSSSRLRSSSDMVKPHVFDTFRTPHAGWEANTPALPAQTARRASADDGRDTMRVTEQPIEPPSFEAIQSATLQVPSCILAANDEFVVVTIRLRKDALRSS